MCCYCPVLCWRPAAHVSSRSCQALVDESRGRCHAHGYSELSLEHGLSKARVRLQTYMVARGSARFMFLYQAQQWHERISACMIFYEVRIPLRIVEATEWFLKASAATSSGNWIDWLPSNMYTVVSQRVKPVVCSGPRRQTVWWTWIPRGIGIPLGHAGRYPNEAETMMQTQGKG